MLQGNGVIVGAYPAAPSFHQKSENQEILFWQQLTKNKNIRGIEQPFLDSLHPFGNEFILKQIPEHWDIVITAIMETMRQRKDNPAFGLASTDKTARAACLQYYRRIYEASQTINEKFKRNKISAIQIQSAPDRNNLSVEDSTQCFYDSIRTIQSWGWSLPIIIEHCDAMTGVHPRKGFLPLAQEIEVARELNISICINWARSVLETRNSHTALEQVLAASKAGVLAAVMFSGTTMTGPYGEWDDLHAPFAPFVGSQAGCADSLMTEDHVRQIFSRIDMNSLQYVGTKLLEINSDADVDHRVSILQDGVLALSRHL